LAGTVRSKENELRVAAENIDRLEEESKTLRRQLDQLENAQEQNSSSLHSEISLLRTQLQESEEKLQRRTDEMTSSKALISTLEEQLQTAKSMLDEKSTENSFLEATRTNLEKSIESLSKKCSDLQTEFSMRVESSDDFCNSLRTQVSDKEIEVEKLKAQLADQVKQFEAFELAQAELSTKICDISAERDEARTSLTQVTQEAKAHKETINSLECQIHSLERGKAQLSSRIEKLQNEIRENEENANTSIQSQEKQLEEIKKDLAKTLVERDDALGKLAKASEELHNLYQQTVEQNDLVSSLRSEITHLSKSVDASKTETQNLELQKEAALSSKTDTEKLLEYKTREVDQLMAKVQVLNATVTRVKTEHALLQDSLSQGDIKSHDHYDSRDDEITRLQSKLARQEDKLSSLTEVYKSQQQVLVLSQSLEDQLLHFVEDILQNAGDSLLDMAQKQAEIDDCGKILLSKRKTLVNAGLDSETLVRMDSVLTQMVQIVPKTKKMLEERHEQLNAWRQRRSLRVPPTPSFSTPNSKPRISSDCSPSVIEALDQMKRVLNDEILTPHKKKRQGSQSIDAQYLQKVVAALEAQIDSLLLDLQSANEALKAKDQLFADLEHLVAHHEDERDNLEKKLHQATMSLAEAERKIEALQDLQNNVKNGASENCKLIAGKMIANYLEDRDDDAKARVFRGWARQTVNGNGATRQTVEALSLELETMREKFMILKKHLKKSRRSKGQLQPVLARILEETSSGQDGNVEAS
jgi:chromosome segregation ATPase